MKVFILMKKFWIVVDMRVRLLFNNPPGVAKKSEIDFEIDF